MNRVRRNHIVQNNAQHYRYIVNPFIILIIIKQEQIDKFIIGSSTLRKFHQTSNSMHRFTECTNDITMNSSRKLIYSTPHFAHSKLIKKTGYWQHYIICLGHCKVCIISQMVVHRLQIYYQGFALFG